MAFDREEFTSLCEEIETYLGWLKGNELVQDYEQQVRETVWHADVDGPTAPVWYRTEPAESEYAVLFANVLAPGNRINEIQENMRLAFESGASWAAGTAGYLESIVLHLVRPDAATLHSAAVAIQDAGFELESAVSAQWTSLNVNNWTGASSDAFQTTVTSFQSVINDQYLRYWMHSSTMFAAACAIVLQFQSGLNPYLTEVRDGLRDQLVNWAQTGGVTATTIHPKIVEGLKIGRKIVDKIPAVGKADGIATLAVEIIGLFMEEPPKLPKDFTMESSDTIYIDLTTTLADDFQREAQDALDTLRSEKSLPVRNAQESIMPWLTPRFPGAADEDWSHQLEG